MFPDKYKSFHRKLEEPKSYVMSVDGTNVPPTVPPSDLNEPIEDDVANKFAETIRKYRDAGYTIVGYGAPAKGNTLMNFANEGPDFIVDDNPLKQLKFTPGMSVPIHIASYLTLNFFEKEKLCFVPLAWNFYDEIKNKIREIRPKHLVQDVFIRYFPNFEVESE